MITKYTRPSGSYAGASGLSNRTKYQDDSAQVPKVAISSSKVDGDFNYIIDALNDMDAAAGSAASIAERLDVAFNADGTLKASVSASVDEWTGLSVTGLTKLDARSIQLNGNQTGILHPGRRVRLTVSSSFVYADVLSSSFASVTTVSFGDIVDSAGTATTFSTHPSAIAYAPQTVGATGNTVKSFPLLQVRNSAPVLRLTPSSGAEFGLQADGTQLNLVQNTGTEAAPSWTTRASITSSGFTLADNTVSLAKLAIGTTGELLTWNASAQPATVAAGSSGQVLTANGSGSAPTFQSIFPSGMMMPFAGDTLPTGWLYCNAAQVSRTTYASLFAAIGETYGSGDGSTTFHLPDLRGRFVLGLDNMGGSTASRVASANSLGDSAGVTLGSGSTYIALHYMIKT